MCKGKESGVQYVQCEDCGVWEHTKCYYGDGKIPEKHFCMTCKTAFDARVFRKQVEEHIRGQNEKVEKLMQGQDAKMEKILQMMQALTVRPDEGAVAGASVARPPSQPSPMSAKEVARLHRVRGKLAASNDRVTGLDRVDEQFLGRS